MKYITKRNTSVLLLMLLTVTIISSCSKWDDYKQYVSQSEILYPGKIDSLKAFTGNKRVRITGLLNADPKVKTVKVFWNNKSDSAVFDASTAIINNTFSQIVSVPEGVANFVIHTYDAAGNRSVPSNLTTDVYGDVYQSGLTNRIILKAELRPDGNAQVDWAEVNANAGVVGVQIKYTSAANVNRDTTISATSTAAFNTVLPNYKPGSKLQYRTLYKPTATAIDTFYSTYKEQLVRYDLDVSNTYLANYKTPFNAIPSSDWRFATLAAPWVVNSAAKNKGGGKYGGWAAEPWQGTTGFINWETWDNTPVNDGIMYQPTSAPLPAGKYTVEYSYYSEVQQNSSVYCVVAAGGNGIPTLANLSTALASSKMYNGASVGATGPSANEVKSFSFTLNTPQVVSIGFLGNLAGAGNPGNYFIVRYIKLIQNN